MIVFVEFNAGAHIQQVPDSGSLISAVCQLGQIGRYLFFKVEYTFVFKYTGDYTQQGFGNRHQYMRGISTHALVIVFIDNFVTVQYKQRVSLCIVTETTQRHQTLVAAINADATEVHRIFFK